MDDNQKTVQVSIHDMPRPGTKINPPVNSLPNVNNSLKNMHITRPPAPPAGFSFPELQTSIPHDRVIVTNASSAVVSSVPVDLAAPTPQLPGALLSTPKPYRNPLYQPERGL